MFDKKRPLSWSSISSFDFDPEQWYRKYALGIQDPKTKEMEFGSIVGERLASDPAYFPSIIRTGQYEFPLEFKFGAIPMVGYIDCWDKDTFDLHEFKTGKKAWTQKRADEHGQFDTYLLGLWVMQKIKPHDVQLYLHWMPTRETGDFRIEFIDEKVSHTFKTQRSMNDILRFGMRVNETYKRMEEFCKNHE